MKYKISILDILEIDDKILKEKESNIAFYTGIIENSIPKKISFKYLYDKTNPSILLEGNFIIKHIEILSQPSEELIPGYNAVIFVQSSTEIETLKNSIELNEKGNIANVYEFSNTPAGV
ncbi:hypothetical protein [Aquimarina sp. AU119]|uniref:hypothetical protein n=1 Tax=Aquimarina sp. AU119 TaxID=2108528 RepID=UPI000D68AD24|nr:hypothetical protein [Aquimarina sp. AU119]